MLLELYFAHGEPMTSAPVNLTTLVDRYSTDEHCREALLHLRWPDGVRCLKCKSENVAPVSDRKVYVCYSCRYQFSVTVGTIFHDSHLPLTKWFLVTYLITESRKGISANQIKRMLGISYKTAWYLCHRIRKAMEESDHKLKGTVEIDEMYIGGHTKNADKWKKHAPVVGIRERGGHLHFISAANLNQDKINEIIARNVDKTVDVIMTDESKLYNFETTKYRGKHKTVNHKAEEYVRYEGGLCVTTNAIESAFSLFKRGVVGTWHKVSVKHLPAYLQEMTWRFNNRKNQYLFRDTLVRLLASDNLEYKELTAA
ncbi:MAG TPA: IS1595 family transposase [Candidatus Dormibacteraeota bacterium]|nr:IS1595 family transposase [Candidatus Dormibacteraeota bacterium]